MITPLNKYILIRKSKKENTTDSGIILSSNEDSHNEQGFIIARGEQVTPSLKEGTKVYFNKYSEDILEVDEEELLVVEEDNIIAYEG